MIIGIGHDVSDIERIDKVLNSVSRDRFLKRILTVEERELSADYVGARLSQYAAGRFAAKEAIVKALGCGIGKTVGFADISISPNECGKPECKLSEAAWERLRLKSDNTRIHVTITHERHLASAFAVVERLIG